MLGRSSSHSIDVDGEATNHSGFAEEGQCVALHGQVSPISIHATGTYDSLRVANGFRCWCMEDMLRRDVHVRVHTRVGMTIAIRFLKRVV